MPDFRALKRKMRRDRHREMLVPALYYPTLAAEPLPVTVRLHLQFKGAINGGLPGGAVASSYAQMVEPEDRIVFRVDELPAKKPRVRGVISVAVGEAYVVEAVDPQDDDEVHAKVTRMPQDDEALGTLDVP